MRRERSVIGPMGSSSRQCENMIIEIAGSVDHLIVADHEKLSDLVCELLRAHRRGDHLLIIPRAECDWLTGNLDLNDREKATLSRIRRDFAQAGSLRAKALLRMKIDVSHVGPPVRDGNKLVLGVEEALRIDFAPVQLVIENSEYDGRLYLGILKGLKDKVDAPAIEFEVRHGGGQTAYHVWRQQIEARRIVALLVDSDRSHFTDPEKIDVLQARSLAAEMQWPIAFAHCLPCREIENLLPISVLEKLPFGLDKAHQIECLKRIEAIERNGNVPCDQRFILYYDLKRGCGDLPLEERFSASTAKWWRSKMAQGGSDAHFTGFGNNVVRYILENSAILHTFLRQIKSDSWWIMYQELFLFLLWLGFAPRRYAT